MEEYNDENVEEKEEESSSSKEEPEEEKEEQDEEKSSSSEEEEREDDEPDYDRVKVGEDLEQQFLKEVQRFLDRGKSKDYAEIAAFNTLLPVDRRNLRKTYLERLKWTHRIKLDAIHRKVMKTLQRFIDEDDMDFDEASESAVEKRKFLLNRAMKKKPLPDDDEEEEDAEENDILVTETLN